MNDKITLQNIKKKLQQAVIEDLKTALKETQATITSSSHKHDSLNLLLARYQQNQQAEIKGENRSDIRIEYNKIRYSLIQIISDLKEKDLVKTKPQSVLSDDLERTSIEKRIRSFTRKRSMLQDRLLRIQGTDASMEYRLEEEIEEISTQLKVIKAQL